MKTLLRSLVLSLGFVPLVACSAPAAETSAAKPAEVKKAFEARFPNRPVQSVASTPVTGIYEVVVQGKQIVYTDAKADYLFVGDLIDTQKRESLTEKKMAELNKVAFSSLPLNDAFKEVRGNGARKLAVFSDPDCPFCHKLEKESLSQLDNVTIYTFLFPLTSLHPDAMHKSKVVWCSKDRTAAWTGWMREGKKLSGAADCATPIDRNLALGEKLGINGTPALIFANGQMVPGAIDKDEIEKLLNAK